MNSTHTAPDLGDVPMFDEAGNQVNRPAEEEQIDEGELLKKGAELMKRFVFLEKQRKNLEAEAKALGPEIAEIDETLRRIMKLMGMQRFSAGGLTVYIRKDVYASAKGEEGENAEEIRERMCDALVKTGHADIVRRTVNANTLASLVREFDPDKERDVEIIYNNMPEELRGVIKVSIVEKISSRKS